MTIFLNLYIATYVITLLFIQLALNMLKINSKEVISIPLLVTYISKFSKFKGIIFSLFFSLTGIPPFIFFFIKFNYLINLLYSLNFIYILILFILFFLNMLFYIQLFLHKNYNYIFNKKFLTINNIINYRKLNITFIVIFYIFLSLLSVFFFIDFYYSLFLLFNL